MGSSFIYMILFCYFSCIASKASDDNYDEYYFEYRPIITENELISTVGKKNVNEIIKASSQSNFFKNDMVFKYIKAYSDIELKIFTLLLEEKKEDAYPFVELLANTGNKDWQIIQCELLYDMEKEDHIKSEEIYKNIYSENKKVNLTNKLSMESEKRLNSIFSKN